MLAVICVTKPVWWGQLRIAKVEWPSAKEAVHQRMVQNCNASLMNFQQQKKHKFNFERIAIIDACKKTVIK